MIYLTLLTSALTIYLLYGVILSIIAKVLGAVLEIPNLICAMILHIKSNGFLNAINQYQLKSATQTDIALHYDFRALWRLTLSKWKDKEGYKFGTNKDETLSSALGRKRIEHTLNWVGLSLYYFLWIIDFTTWKKRGHCKDAYYSYLEKTI